MMPGCKCSLSLVRPARLKLATTRRGGGRISFRRETIEVAESVATAKKRTPRWLSKKVNPRTEYREQESARVEASATLASSYPRLRALTVELTYFDREIVSWGRGVKYRANLENARSVLRFHCPSALCIGGDFDLSETLARAVGMRQTKRAGELCCKGSRRQPTGELVPCESTLHYKLIAAYRVRQLTRKVRQGSVNQHVPRGSPVPPTAVSSLASD
jgi:hypothetical protein